MATIAGLVHLNAHCGGTQVPACRRWRALDASAVGVIAHRGHDFRRIAFQQFQGIGDVAGATPNSRAVAAPETDTFRIWIWSGKCGRGSAPGIPMMLS